MTGPRVLLSPKGASGSSGEQIVQQPSPPQIDYSKVSGPTRDDKTVNHSDYIKAINAGGVISETSSESEQFDLVGTAPISESYEMKLEGTDFMVDFTGTRFGYEGYDVTSAKLNSFWVPRSWGNLSLAEGVQEEMRLRSVKPLTELAKGFFTQHLTDVTADENLINNLTTEFESEMISRYQKKGQYGILTGSADIIESVLAGVNDSQISQEKKDNLIKDYRGRISNLSLTTVADVSYYSIATSGGTPIAINNNYDFASNRGPGGKASVGYVASRITGVDNINPMVFLDPTQKNEDVASQFDQLLVAHYATQTILLSNYTTVSQIELDKAYEALGVPEFERNTYRNELVETCDKALDKMEVPAGTEAEYITRSMGIVAERMQSIRDKFAIDPSAAALKNARNELLYFTHLVSNDRWSLFKRDAKYRDYVGPSSSGDYNRNKKFAYSTEFYNQDNSDFLGTCMVQHSLDKVGRGYSVNTSSEYEIMTKVWVDADEASAGWDPITDSGKAVTNYHVQIIRGGALTQPDPEVQMEKVRSIVQESAGENATVDVRHEGNEYIATITKDYDVVEPGALLDEKSSEDEDELSDGTIVTSTSTVKSYDPPIYSDGRNSQTFLLTVPGTFSKDAKPVPAIKIEAKAKTSDEFEDVEIPKPSGLYMRGSLGYDFMGFNPKNRSFMNWSPSKSEVGDQGKRFFKGAVPYANAGEWFANRTLADNPIPISKVMDKVPDHGMLGLDFGAYFEGQDIQTKSLDFFENVFDQKLDDWLVKYLNYEHNGEIFKMDQEGLKDMADQNFRDCMVNYYKAAYYKWVYENTNDLNMDKSEAGRRWKEAERDLLVSGAKFAGMSEENCHMWNSMFWRSMDGLAESLTQKGLNVSVGVNYNWLGEHHTELVLTASANPNFKIAETGLAAQTSNILGLMGTFIHTTKWDETINFRIRFQGGSLFYMNPRIQQADAEVLQEFTKVTNAFDHLWSVFDTAMKTGQPVDEQTKNSLCDEVYTAAMNMKNRFPDESEISERCLLVMKWANDLKYRKTAEYRNDLDQLKSAYQNLAYYISIEKTKRFRSDSELGIFNYNHITGASEGAIDELTPSGNLELVEKGEQDMQTSVPFATAAIEVFGTIPIADNTQGDYLLTARPPPSLFIRAMGIREDDEMSTEEFIEGVEDGLPFMDTNMPTLDLNMALSQKFLDPIFQKQVIASVTTAMNLNHFSMTQLKGSIYYRPIDKWGNTYAPMTIGASYGFQRPIGTGKDWDRSLFQSPRSLNLQLTQALPMIMNGLVLQLDYSKQWHPIGTINEKTDVPERNYGATSNIFRATIQLDFDILGSPSEKLPPTPAHAWEPFPDARVSENIKQSIQAPKKTSGTNDSEVIEEVEPTRTRRKAREDIEPQSNEEFMDTRTNPTDDKTPETTTRTRRPIEEEPQPQQKEEEPTTTTPLNEEPDPDTKPKPTQIEQEEKQETATPRTRRRPPQSNEEPENKETETQPQRRRRRRPPNEE